MARAKPGRNSPCPCGSGKKYKNCCLKKDRAQRIRESTWRREEQATLERLTGFAQRPEFRTQFVVASNLFWNGNYGVEGISALGREELGRFLDWFVFDYRLEEVKKRIIELFVEEAGPRLPRREFGWVRTWSESYASVYRIGARSQDGSLVLTDVAQAIDEHVLDEGLSRLGLGGDLILGRLLRSSQPPHFSWAAILLPADYEAELAARARTSYRQYEEMAAQATWPEFLSNQGYILNHHILRIAARAGAKDATYGAYYNARDTVTAFGEAEKRLQERTTAEVAKRQAAKRQREDHRVKPRSEESLRKTRGGILLPGHVEYGDSERT